MSSSASALCVDSGKVEDHKAPNKTVTFWQKTHQSVGFKKGYNLALFIVFAGAMMGFTLARLPYLNVGGSAQSSYRNGSSPGEWYWFKSGFYRIGITIHLAAILPAGFLMVWQFVPIIRYKFLLFHRINGYLVIFLVFISNVGALMIARHAFGGSLETQAGLGVLAILSTTSICHAYYNVKQLQIDQHRAWMLRAVFYLGTIITLRIIMIISAQIITKVDSFNTVMSCGEINSIYARSGGSYGGRYPLCSISNAKVNQYVAVHASFQNRPEEIGASLRMSFGMALWLALAIHAIGVEVYLSLTPKESERLRQVSVERQIEMGLKVQDPRSEDEV
ncbi:hypothetical protein BU16DRAFT_577705 [Lophium mytilinum]|uniref:DUF2306 domain-containing protein n=1 Tax=Lophium mytilinum TaxID=390894 RepID=A0A6A6RDS0_9PEZI|nr:hypothetical protein BU16DRAFT_577705 [Lophium mytilinum]